MNRRDFFKFIAAAPVAVLFPKEPGPIVLSRRIILDGVEDGWRTVSEIGEIEIEYPARGYVIAGGKLFVG